MRGRLLRGSRVAAEPSDGHHLRRLVPGTGKRCVCSWPCPEPHARQRGDRAVPNLPPRLRRERAWTRRIGPDSCAWPWTNPGRNPALPKETERVPSAARPQTCGDEGPRRPPTAGTTHRGQTSVPVRGEYPNRPSPCGRLVGRSLPGQDGYPQGTQAHAALPQAVVAYTGRKLLSGYGRCQKGCHPQLPRIYCQDV